MSAIRETNFELWTVTNMAPGYPAAAGLPTCRPRESTYAPPLLSRHHLRIGNLLANFVQCFVPFRRPRLHLLSSPSVLPSERSSRNDRVYFDFSSNRPPTRLPITFSFSNSQFIGPRTATNFPFALHPSSRNIFRLTFSHYFHSTVSSCSLLFSIAKCLDTLVIRNP